MTEEISKPDKQMKLVELMDEVKHLKMLIKEKDKKIEDLGKKSMTWNNIHCEGVTNSGTTLPGRHAFYRSKIKYKPSGQETVK